MNRAPEAPGYDRLTGAERDRLTATIADLVALLERSEAAYIDSGGDSDYQWGYRAAIAARQVDDWLRCIPEGWRPGAPPFPSKDTLFLLDAGEVRERAMAANIDWILEREGEDAKVLLFAHRYHLSNAPVFRRFDAPGLPEWRHQMAGTYLKRRLGDRLVTIANVLGGGEVAIGRFRQVLEQAHPDTLDGIAAEIDPQDFVLDLRRSPPELRGWLDQVRPGAHAHGKYEFRLPAGSAFDAIVYIRKVTPACP